MARSGLANILLRLREMTATGYSDYAVNGVAYWTDDQLQVYLDRYRTPYRYRYLKAVPDYTAGDYTYTEYHLPHYAKHIEESDGFRITSSDGTTIAAANYSVNFEAGIVTFTTDQDNADRYADFRAYDLNKAAADIWDAKAAHVAERVDFAIDNHDIKASQMIKQYRENARYHRSQGGPVFAKMYRTDEA